MKYKIINLLISLVVIQNSALLTLVSSSDCGGEIMSGYLECKKGNSLYPIIEGAPSLLPQLKVNSGDTKSARMELEIRKTKKIYGFLWSKQELEKRRGSTELPYHFETVIGLLSFSSAWRGFVAGCRLRKRV
ncbi:MAG: hypothetical protein DRP74_01960 [Candidatus Omnitrophota bacterium]|nr:MAG: hypothetical protein DRP74_01960 [Candidatus Omnitrophota bacterium]